MYETKKPLESGQEEQSGFDLQKVIKKKLNPGEKTILVGYLDGYEKERMAEIIKRPLSQVEAAFFAAVKKIKSHPDFPKSPFGKGARGNARTPKSGEHKEAL